MIDLPGNNFLVPDATVFVEAAVFLIVLFVVAKWVMPRMQATLEQRRRRIEDELQAASLAEVVAEEREEQAAEVLRQAHREARAILDRAYEQRDYLVSEGMRKGREEYEWFTRARPIPPPAVNNDLVEVLPASATTGSTERERVSAG